MEVGATLAPSPTFQSAHGKVISLGAQVHAAMETQLWSPHPSSNIAQQSQMLLLDLNMKESMGVGKFPFKPKN